MDVLKTKYYVPKTTSQVWQIGTLIGIFVLMFIYFQMAFWYSYTYGQYRSTPSSIEKLLTIRRELLSTAIDPLVQNTESVCSQIIRKNGVYSQITTDAGALVNWRPLTTRLTGYLGGINSARDGVFDMVKGVQLALSQGSRAFIFEIDYLNDYPCLPVIIMRDDKGYMRSLHTGSIKVACQTLAQMAFVRNYDPVMIILYLRRIPKTQTQQTKFFGGIASSLDPLSMYHLGTNEQGNFHNCRSESILFTSPITNYQKKFIVLCNYNTTVLPSTPNPKDNLDFWVNARIYSDPSGISGALGSVTTTVPNGQIPYAQVGSTTQLLNIGSADQLAYVQTSSNTFKIALSAVEFTFSPTQLNLLLNTLGIQCVPLDVIALSALPAHQATLQSMVPPVPPKRLNELANATNTGDLLSYWTYSGWSRKLIINTGSTSNIEGYTNPAPVAPIPLAKPIQGFIIPPPIVPKRPPPSTNSNGGLVSIS